MVMAAATMKMCNGARRRRFAPMSPVSTQDLAAHLKALSDREIAGLLSARPDLLHPPAPSLSALALRAGARPSVEQALADMDAPTLAVAQALVLYEGESTETPATIAHALDLPPDDVAAARQHLADLALSVGGRPVAGLAEALGPHPFGLAPPAAREPDTLPPALPDLQEAARSGGTGGIPPSSVEMLEVLTWGPPVGTLRPGGSAPAAGPLVERGWLQRSSDAQGRTRFVLPRQVAMALRGGRLTREDLTAPDPDALGRADARTVAGEAAFQAEEAVRLVEALLEEWGREAAPILRSGGVGVRTLTRTAEALEADPAQAARVIETAAAAGLLGLDEAGASWEPSRLAQDWAGEPLPQRWAPLAAAWAHSPRTPWLVGTRDDKGALRSVLSADLEAGWARRLRRRLLTLMAALPEGTMVTPAFVRDRLTHERPRRIVPPGAVTAVIDEARALGILGSQALSRAGGALARGIAAQGGQDAPDLLAALEEALAADLPEAVGTLLVQSDLTAIVPGRPDPRLARLLGRTSTVESRGGALGVRFTPDSVRGALDAGCTAEEILADLAGYSPSPLPSALTALVQDASRRHGAVRVRAASSILRVQDEAVAAGLLTEARLKALSLTRIAPGILISSAPPGQVVRELRRTGLSPALEDSHGALVRVAQAAGARRAPAPAYPGCQAPAGAGSTPEPPAAAATPRARSLAAVVTRMREGEARRAADPAEQVTDPAHALAVLRQAQATRSRVLLRLAGADGAVQERRARVLAIEPGRVRLRDIVRDTELTVAAHRIVSVAEEC